MARIKPDPHVVENRAQCEGALAEMAALDRKLSAIENEMRETVDGAKAKAGQLAGPLQARRKELADAVAVFARLNRQELFAKSKSLDMGFGVIGFRASTKIVQIRGVTAGEGQSSPHSGNDAGKAAPVQSFRRYPNQGRDQQGCGAGLAGRTPGTCGAETPAIGHVFH